MIELILAPVIAKAVGHYGDQVFPAIDAQVKYLLRRAQSLPTGPDRDAAWSEAEVELAAAFVREPETSGEVALQAMSPPPGQGAPTAMLSELERSLTGVFELVTHLKPAVIALPGGFNCTECVSVVDGRAKDGPDFRMPYRSWEDFDTGRILPNYFHWPFEDSYELGMPRIWLIRSGNTAERDDTVERLNTAFASEDHKTAPEYLDSFLPNLAEIPTGEIARMVKLYESRLEVQTSAEPIMSTESILMEYAERAKRQESLRAAGFDDDFLSIRDASGVRLMKEALADTVARRDQEAARLLADFRDT